LKAISIDNEFESEDETYPMSRFLSSVRGSVYHGSCWAIQAHDHQIQALPAITIHSASDKAVDDRTPLKRMLMSNLGQVPKVSSNAFKNLPPVQSTTANKHGLADNTDSGSAFTSSPQQPLAAVTNAEKRQRSNSSPAPFEPSSKKSKPEAPVPGFHEGVKVDPKNPKASDYEDVANALILRAASEYECLIATEDAFPDMAKRNKWARKTWKGACAAAGEHFEITDAISKLACFSFSGH